MSKEEEYLDQLLHEMSPVEKKVPKKPLFVSKSDNEDSSDFLSQFEEELDSFDDKDFLSELEEELQDEGEEEEEELSGSEPGDIWSGLNKVMNPQEEDTTEKSENNSKDDTTAQSDDFNGAPEQPMNVNNAMDEPSDELKGELDDKDVVNLIEEDENAGEELDEIAQMLKAQDNNEDIPGGEEDEEINQSQPAEEIEEELPQVDPLPETVLTEEKPETDKGIENKKVKSKPEGFFSRLSKLLFGEPEQEDEIQIPEEGTLSNISDENKEILAELERTSAKTSKKKQEKDDKKKAAQEKKDAKKKAAAEKKKESKKKKAEKPKKEKTPKIKEPSLPKVPVILIWLMALSILGLIVLATNLGGYRIAVKNAKNAYQNQNYLEAYQYIAGQSMKTSDQTLYTKCSLMADLTMRWNSYQMYMSLDKKEQALDCLVQGVGNYSKNNGLAEEVGISPEYGQIRKNMLTELKSQFGMTEEKTLSLYSIRKRQEYTYQLMKVLQ